MNDDILLAYRRDQLYTWFCQIYRAFPKLTMEIIASKDSEYTDLIGEVRHPYHR